MDAATSMAIAELRRKVDSLTSQLRGSIGVSSSGGSLNIRTTQLGFAAQLTSTYNATTGYSWKRLFLNTTTPAFTNPTIQPTGNLAFEVTGSTSVANSTKVWMEPSPDASGYVFTSLSASAPALIGKTAYTVGSVFGYTQVLNGSGGTDFFTDSGDIEYTASGQISGTGTGTMIIALGVWSGAFAAPLDYVACPIQRTIASGSYYEFTCTVAVTLGGTPVNFGLVRSFTGAGTPLPLVLQQSYMPVVATIT